MFHIALATAVLAAGSALAQGQSALPPLPSMIGPLSFSPQCQQAVIGVATQGALAQCFPFADLFPLLSTNTSIIPFLDKFQTDLCYNYPTCSQATLTAAAQTVAQGCAEDLKKDGIAAQTIIDIFSAYPIVREVLCLKTTDPYTAKSYGGFLGAPPIPIVGNPIYNSTDGTFCLTSVATQLSAYFGTQLTVPYLAGLVSGQNSTALALATSINPNIVCNTCFFAALEIVDLIIPAVGNTPVAAVIQFFMAMVPKSLGATTINQLFDWTCAYKPLSLVLDGKLPNGVSVSIVNSSYPIPISNGQPLPVNCQAKREEVSLFGRKRA